MRRIFKPILKLSLLGGAFGVTYSLGIWDPPSETNQPSLKLIKWKQISNNFIEDNLKFDFLRNVDVPVSKSTKEKIQLSLSGMKFEGNPAHNWNSGLDYCIEGLFAAPTKISNGCGYVASSAKNSIVEQWNKLNATTSNS